MPLYDFTCEHCAETVEVSMPMSDLGVQVFCPMCHTIMRRRFTMPRINWNGLAPSQGEMHPTTKQMIADAERRRDQETPHQSRRLAELNRRLQDG